jgi:hypothetical protein
MNVRLKKTLHFTAGVWYDNSLQMNNYMAELDMYTNSDDPINQNIAFERLKYFVYHELDSSVIIDQDELEQCTRLVSAGLKITTMPGLAVDQSVGIMLYYKLNAIMEQRLIVTDVAISSTLGDHVVYLHNQDEDANNIVKPKWWTTADLSHSDHVAGDSNKVVDLCHAVNWQDLDLGWPEPAVAESGNVVAFADIKRHDTE